MIRITIKNDDEGFYGSSSTEEIEAINHAASVERFNQQVKQAIRQECGEELEITMEYGPYAGASVIVSDDDRGDTDTITLNIQEIIGRVYDNGTFWVEKK